MLCHTLLYSFVAFIIPWHGVPCLFIYLFLSVHVFHEERHFVLYTTVSPQHRLVLGMCQIFLNICVISYFISFLERIKTAINLTAWDKRNLFSHHSESETMVTAGWLFLGGSCVTCLSPGFWSSSQSLMLLIHRHVSPFSPSILIWCILCFFTFSSPCMLLWPIFFL